MAGEAAAAPIEGVAQRLANADQILGAAAALFNTFTFDKLIPLISLLLMCWLFVWVLFKAQGGGNFDTSEFLRETDGPGRGKLSWKRLAAFICLIVHTWYIFTRTLTDKVTFNDMALYCLTWSSSMILLEGLNVWRGVQTSRSATPPPVKEEAP